MGEFDLGGSGHRMLGPPIGAAAGGKTDKTGKRAIPAIDSRDRPFEVRERGILWSSGY